MEAINIEECFESETAYYFVCYIILQKKCISVYWIQKGNRLIDLKYMYIAEEGSLCFWMILAWIYISYECMYLNTISTYESK